MTVIIGIKCKDGVIMASDSQTEFERGSPVKRINAFKMQILGDKIAIGGAGMMALIDKTVSKINDYYNSIVSKGYNGLSSLIEGTDENAQGAEYIVSTIHKTYNVERPNYIYGGSRPDEVFDFYLMLGGMSLNSETGGSKPDLYILYENGIAEPEQDYATIGSGAPYAEYLLSKYYSNSIELDGAIKLAIFVISEVQKMDPNVGGKIKVIRIDDQKAKRIDEAEINQKYLEIEKKIEQIDENLRTYFLTGGP
ncbi:MAG: hypothetical protein ACP5FQ_06740 [Thermoplasmata archaeon]